MTAIAAPETLIESKGRAWERFREVNDHASARDLTGEEQAELARLGDQLDLVSNRQQVEERRRTEPRAFATALEIGDPACRAWAAYLRAGRTGVKPVDVGYLQPTRDWRASLQADSDPGGGALVAPIQWVDDVFLAVNNLLWIRQYATIVSTDSAQSLGIPALDTDIADADWTVELAIGNEDTAMAVGRRELHPHPFAKFLKVSKKLLARARRSEETVRDRLAYKVAVTEEKAFLVGSGASQPLGIFTASTSGVDTSRDVSAGNTATGIGVDGLINAKDALKGAYLVRPSTMWLFHRDAVQKIRQLKDTNGQYLWAPGLGAGEPNQIIDLPYAVSEYVPNTFTTGLYVGALADVSMYVIADSLQVAIQRLDELYAITNQCAFIARAEVDGMPALGEAFVRVKLA